ncbi:MAG: NAD(P)H-dependent oxidoreductase [Candidatus Delongbacteria bacterium]|nr:NAD(P)H-dependent oxidoreductase [Candidatus Delongbacteria bacterium]
MKILVLHGSPKGDISVTMQYIKYLEVYFPEHEWNAVLVGSMIRSLEKEQDRFDRVMEDVSKADLIIWSFPVYHLLVPYQVKRFIELIGERGAAGAFNGKYAVALMTSIHFMDHSARNYIHAVCEDLGMQFGGTFSAEMNDLLKKPQQMVWRGFMKHLIDDVAEKRVLPRAFSPISNPSWNYIPVSPLSKTDPTGLKVSLIADYSSGGNVRAMADRLKACLGIDPIDISRIDIKNGCSGCCQCGFDNCCIYDGTDSFKEVFVKTVMEADVVIYLGAIRDRYLSSAFKKFFDRSFVFNHAPIYREKQLAWLVSGPLAQIPNLRQIMEIYPGFSHGNLAGIVSDEVGSSQELDALIDTLAARCISLARDKIILPQDFLGIGGMKVFRDSIWGELRMVFQQDYRLYRRLKLFDFPQKKIFNRTVVPLVSLMLKIPFVRRAFQKKSKQGMIMAHAEVVKKARAGQIQPTV